jgi:hypothetical protein
VPRRLRHQWSRCGLSGPTGQTPDERSWFNRNCPHRARSLLGDHKLEEPSRELPSLIAEFYLVDRGLRHRLPGFSSMGRLVILPWGFVSSTAFTCFNMEFVHAFMRGIIYTQTNSQGDTAIHLLNVFFSPSADLTFQYKTATLVPTCLLKNE